MTERDLFIAVLECPPADRDGYLDRACASDPALRTRVAALLDFHARPVAVLDRPVTPSVPPAEGAAPDEPPGTVIAGRYTLLGVVGRGGMGTVYLARQTEPVEREVAVKVIRGRASPAALARFAAERQTLAVMSHPGIARIYDGGTTPAGQPFFVMEFVQGEPITDFCDRRRLSIAARLGLFVGLCEAVQHAHQKGIVHRDLKPTNVLAADADGRPTATVIDFGIAVAPHAADGVIAGTRDYMAPEQAAGVPDIDTRADVYSLGVVLFELLTGVTPGSPPPPTPGTTEPRRGPVGDTLPSERVRSSADLPAVSAARSVPPARLPRLLRGDLDWVVGRCLDRDRERRYPTVAALAEDVRLFLAGRPIASRPVWAGARLAKWGRRNPGLAGLAAAVLLLGVALGAGAAVTTHRLNREAAEQARLTAAAEHERERARDEEAKAQAEAAQAAAMTETLKELYAPHDPLFFVSACLGFRDARTNPSENDLLRLGATRVAAQDRFRARPLLRAELLHNIGTAYLGLGMPRDAAPLFEEALDLRRRHLAPGHADLAPSLVAVAQVRTMLTDVVAEELFREALDVCGRNPDADRLAEAEATYAMFLLHYWGEKAEAEPLLDRAYGRWHAARGEADPKTLSALLLIVSLKLDGSEYLAAAPRAVTLLAGLEKCKARPELLACGRAWVDMLTAHALRGNAGAVAQGRRAVAEFTRVFGPDHYLTARVRYTLAWQYMHAENSKAAIDTLRECEQSFDRLGLPNTFARAQTNLHLGRVHRVRREWPDAVAHLTKSIELFRRLARRPAECRSEYLWALQALARTLEDEGGHPPAAMGALFDEAAAYCLARPRVEEWRRGYAFLDAGLWHLRHGDPSVAVGHCHEAVASWEKDRRDLAPPILAEAHAFHSAALRRAGREAEADEAARRCRDTLSRVRIPNLQVIIARNVLDGRLPTRP